MISRKRVKAAPDGHEKLMERLSRLEEKGSSNSSEDGRSWRVEVVTNVNVFLYAACFFIQTGTLPVCPHDIQFAVGVRRYIRFLVPDEEAGR